MALRQKVSSFTTLSGERPVHSDKDGSGSKLSFATFAAKSVGTLVNSDTTSKETRVITGERVRHAKLSHMGCRLTYK